MTTPPAPTLAEVEAALHRSQDRLADAVAVGLPSRISGQSVAAAVVALPGVAPDVAALQSAVSAALGTHAVPRRVRVVDALPRNRNGKVDRAQVLALLSGPATG